LQNEVSQLTSELDRIAQATEFNGQKLFDGTFGTATFQVGANANQVIQASTTNLRTNSYGNNQVVSAGAEIGANVLGWAGASAVASGALNGVAAGTIDISGYLGTKALIAVNVNDSAKNISTAVNQNTASTGVTAVARTQAELTFSATGSYVVNLASDNTTDVAVSFSVSATGTTAGLAEAMQAFNDQAAKTGVTAALNAAGNGVVLTNASGADIKLGNAATNVGLITVQGLDQNDAALNASKQTATLTASRIAVAGYVTFNSERSFSVTPATTAFTAAGTSTLKDIANMDVTTFSKATDALYRVDSALTTVNNLRSRLGALQSRFENTISNLSATSENISGARSRIRDADFAMETANLTRNQILQQAGIAMLAQANALPNQVLTLLRG
jgi:flagellin